MIYRKGLSERIDSNGKKIGSAYLEMTGHAQPLRMQLFGIGFLAY